MINGIIDKAVPESGKPVCLMTVNENQGNAINTWLPGDKTTPVLCVCGKKITSRGETSQLRQAESIACETDKLPLSRHLHALAVLHLHLHTGPGYSLSGVTGASLEDCFTILEEGEVLVNRGYNISVCLNCPLNNYIYLMLEYSQGVI